MKFFRGLFQALPISLALWGVVFIGLAHAQTQGQLVQGNPIQRSTVNRSVVITTGNTFQTVLASTVSRVALTVENNNATDSCWLFIGSASATKATSILLLAGGSYVRYWPFVPNDTLKATCASDNDTLYIDTQ